MDEAAERSEVPDVSLQSGDTDRYLEELERAGRPTSVIPVHISYEIIRLFSEGLYQSPQKAIEELVSNSYDANASEVHVLLPQEPSADDDAEAEMPPLWVIDDGHGLDEAGFSDLWRVAHSKKAALAPVSHGRAPIGQFGIGKLAAYVLSWRLTHVSCVNGVIRFTSMDFRRLTGVHQYDDANPLQLSLREISREDAMRLLRDIEPRDKAAWNLMFGPDARTTWTAAALSDFKDLYDKLSTGRLSWVLRTGLPLHAKFKIWLNGVELTSSKTNIAVIRSYVVGGANDAVARSLDLETTSTGVKIPGLAGEVNGIARIYEKRLTEGKSDQYGRSHGFFVSVRERVINLEDELFGLDALNHAAWARFSMEVAADGLRDHLLSSREGVRDSDTLRTLRSYLHGVFNKCRNAYDSWAEKTITGLDIQQLLSHAPSVYVTEPLSAGVQRVLEAGEESYYVAYPDIAEDTHPIEWIHDFQERVSKIPFKAVLYEPTGKYDRAIRYIPDTRTLIINTEHPFIEKLLAMGRNRAPATLFGSAELLIDVLLQEQGFSRASIVDFLADRDRTLRLVAGEQPSTASEALRLLKSALTHETALERAVGLAFKVLGFEYERRGGNVPGPDGVLYARLGRGIESLTDYKVVYDSKQTNHPSVAAAKINIDSLDDFRNREKADFGFFVAAAYDAQDLEDGKLNRLVINAVGAGRMVTLLTVDHVRSLVELHYRFGVTLTRLRSLFVEAHTVPQVTRWIDDLESELTHLEPQVPLMTLLEALEDEKTDPKATPSVYAVRADRQQLRQFTPERLTASLQAVETIVGKRWLEVENSGLVRLHHTAGQIVAEVERHLRSLLGVDTAERDHLS